MFGHAVLGIFAQVGLGEHSGVERLFLGGGMGRHLDLELVEQLFQPVVILFARRFRHLVEQLAMGVMILFQAIENAGLGHGQSSFMR